MGLKQVPLPELANYLGQQQSHHCGIETSDEFQLRLSPERSNRTIVGLKLAALGQAYFGYQLAAIAPLWD